MITDHSELENQARLMSELMPVIRTWVMEKGYEPVDATWFAVGAVAQELARATGITENKDGFRARAFMRDMPAMLTMISKLSPEEVVQYLYAIAGVMRHHCQEVEKEEPGGKQNFRDS